MDLTVEAAAHCTVYYSEGKNLQQVEAGTRIIRTTAGPYGIVFFAAPEEGYALTVLAAVSTQQKYYTISNWSDDGSGMTAAEQAACDEYVDALKDHAGFTDEQLRSMVSQARALGCDGSLMFTRGADNSYGINSTLQFRAERLPTLEKEILSVTDADGVETPYQPGMSVGAGDVVTYGLTVTAYALEYPVDSVYYTGVTVTDPKTGNGAEDPIPFTLPGKKELMELKEDREITREVTYTVTQADADAGTLSNEAQLHFQYASIYSAGSLSTTSSAQATVLVRSPVRYAYVSADPDLELPWELANLAPADPAAYDYQAEVTALGHDVMIWEDRERQGTWTLTAGGDWDLAGTAVSPGDTFSMPMEAVTLTASWSFAPWAAIRVERSAQVTAFQQDEKDQNRVRYGAEHTIAIQNTGGEPLTRFVLQDAALSGEGDYTCKIHGEVVTPAMSYDPESGTFAVELPGVLPAGETLTITFAKGGSALGENGIFTLQCQVEVQAWGGREGVQAQGEAQLQAPFSLSDAIVLTPADIVIYAGGAPSDSEVVDDDGRVVAGSNLPEPGFFVALPTKLAAELREKVGSTGLQEGKIDLSGLLEFRRGDEKGWQLEKFDADGYSLARGSFLYRLVPPEEGQAPVRMQFYDGQDYIVASDFDISQALHKEYAMSIYPGGETGSEVRAVVKVGEEEKTCSLGFAPGRLIIRGTTGDRDTVAILPPEEAPGEAVAAITAQAPAEVHYYINSSQLQVDDPGAVELLVDSIADSDHHETMKRLAEPVLSALGTDARTRYQFRYLDLVDTSMGNAWVTADRPVEVYWPYPAGTGPGDDFTIIHYAGLDREFDLEDLGSLVLGTDYDLEVFTTARPLPADGAHVTYHALAAAEQGLRFAAGSFSPYVLVWEEPEGGAVLPGGDDDDDDDESGSREEAPAPSGLNTGDHLAYLMGRGDGGLQPQAPITRGEMAAILFRLLSDEALAAHWSTETVYPDLPEGTWNHNAVATLTAMGIVEGYPNGDFGSNDLISRAELVTMAVRFFQPAETAGQTFPDVPAEAWYADAVATAAALGLAKGQDDGTFGPERPITRAETAAILNRALGRTPGTGELPDWVEGWTDVPADAWYDGDMLEAALSHRFTWTETPDGRAELWTAPMEEPDWAALERYGPDALK